MAVRCDTREPACGPTDVSLRTRESRATSPPTLTQLSGGTADVVMRCVRSYDPRMAAAFAGATALLRSEDCVWSILTAHARALPVVGRGAGVGRTHALVAPPLDAEGLRDVRVER